MERPDVVPPREPGQVVCAHVIMVWHQTGGDVSRPWTVTGRKIPIRCGVTTPHDIHKAGPVVWE